MPYAAVGGRTRSLNELIGNGQVKFRDYIDRAAKARARPSEALFANSLRDIVRYGDAREFFERTELVPRLKEFVMDVLRRVLAMPEANYAFLLETIMGGGKTHAMAYIYFMFKERDVAVVQPEIRGMLKELKRESLPDVEVVDIDGNDLDIRRPLNEQEKLRAFFGESGTRGAVTFEFQRRGKPVVILMDELLDYFSKRGDQFGADLAFLKTLLEGAAASRTGVVIISLPSDYHDRERYHQVSSMFKNLGRKMGIYHLLEGTYDFAAIAKKQIFEYVDERAAEEAARHAVQVCAKEGISEREDLYRSTFPFHPNLISIVWERFTYFENFQKTRDSLKLLVRIAADVLARYYAGEKFNTPFITPGDVDLNAVKDRLTSPNTFGIQNLDAVVLDVTERSPDDLTRRLATVVYLYSLFEPEKAGADAREIYVSLLEGDVGIEDLEKKLRAFMERHALYLDEDRTTRRFVFRSKPNVYSLINQRANRIGDPFVNMRHLREIVELKADDEILSEIGSIQELKPVRHRLNLFFLSPQSIIGALEEGQDTRSAAEDIAARASLFKGDDNVNGVVVVYPSSLGCLQRLMDAGRRLAAIEELKAEYKADREMRDKLAEDEKATRNSLVWSFIGCYTNLMWLRAGIEHEPLTISTMDRESYMKGILSLLASSMKAYTSQDLNKLNLEAFFKELLGGRTKYMIADAYKDIELTTPVPFLTYAAFRAAVAKAVKDGLIGYGDEDSPVIGRDPGQIDDRKFILRRELAERPPAPRAMGTAGPIPAAGVEGAEVQLGPQQVRLAQPPPQPRPSPRVQLVREQQDIVDLIEMLDLLRYYGGEGGGEFSAVLVISGDGEVRLDVKPNKLPDLKVLVGKLLNLFGDRIRLRLTVELTEEQLREVEKLGGGKP